MTRIRKINTGLAVVVAIAALAALWVTIESRHSSADALQLGALRGDASKLPLVESGSIQRQAESAGDCADGSRGPAYIVLRTSGTDKELTIGRFVQALKVGGWEPAPAVGAQLLKRRSGAYVETVRANDSGPEEIVLSSEAKTNGKC